MSQVVDTETAREFIRETLDKVASEELVKICGELEQKSSWMQGKLEARTLRDLSSADFYAIFRRIFATRRKVDSIMERYSLEQLRAWTAELLYGDDDIGARFAAFTGHLDSLAENVRCDLASELLHFTNPDGYWLWTRWMWDPRTKTGALPLVTSAKYELTGETTSEIYMKVGRAVSFVHEVGRAAGFQAISQHIFGTDVFLSCVYVIYAYTVLRMRMTQEFNRVMPKLPEFSRRLLGVHRISFS